MGKRWTVWGVNFGYAYIVDGHAGTARPALFVVLNRRRSHNFLFHVLSEFLCVSHDLFSNLLRIFLGYLDERDVRIAIALTAVVHAAPTIVGNSRIVRFTQFTGGLSFTL